MRVVFEGWKPYVDDFTILLKTLIKTKITREYGVTCLAEYVSNVLLVGGRREVGDKQGRLRAKRNLNGVAIKGLLIASLRSLGVFSRIKFNHGYFGATIFSGKHLNTVDRTTLSKLVKMHSFSRGGSSYITEELSHFVL